MLDEINLPQAVCLLRALEVAEGGQHGSQMDDRSPGAACACEPQGGFERAQEAVDGRAADAAQFAQPAAADRKMRLGADGVAIGVEEGDEAFSALAVKRPPMGVGASLTASS
jgi:hypothetical protein